MSKSVEHQYRLARVLWTLAIVALLLLLLQRPLIWIGERLSFRAFWSPFYSWYWVLGIEEYWPFQYSLHDVLSQDCCTLLIQVICMGVGCALALISWAVVGGAFYITFFPERKQK